MEDTETIRIIKHRRAIRDYETSREVSSEMIVGFWFCRRTFTDEAGHLDRVLGQAVGVHGEHAFSTHCTSSTAGAPQATRSPS
ncbi:MAG: hypothetical protein ACFFB7_04050, partial [Candidatus Sifarchaeia archaeon]